jgi:hypothetical protein
MQNEIKLPDEFFEKSIVLKYYFDLFLEADKGFTTEYIITEICTHTLRALRSFLEAMLNVSRLIERNQFQEAWLIVKSCHSYKPVNTTFKEEFVHIRSQIPTIITTASIYSDNQLKDTKKAWAGIDTKEDDHEDISDPRRIYREFKKLKSIEELINFNRFFKDYIHQLIFDFIDKHVRRMDYTLEYFKDEEFYKKVYKSERRKLDKFISKTNRLKKQLMPAL